MQIPHELDALKWPLEEEEEEEDDDDVLEGLTPQVLLGIMSWQMSLQQQR
jgi:hypothetical protein